MAKGSSIIGRIHAGIVAVLLGTTLPLVFLLYWLVIVLSRGGNNAARRGHQYISRPWARCILWLSGVRLIVRGTVPSVRNGAQESRPWLLISNHRSYLDIPVSALTTTLPFAFLAKQELRRVPMLGWIINKVYFTVDRGTKAGGLEAIKKMWQVMRDEKRSVWVFAEGTRNKKDNNILPLQSGSLGLAKKINAPIGICTMWNTAAHWPNDKGLWIKSGRVTATWDVIENPAEYASVEELTQACQEIMQQRLAEMQGVSSN